MLSFGFLVMMSGIFIILLGVGIKLNEWEKKPEPVDRWEEPLQKGAGRE